MGARQRHVLQHVDKNISPSFYNQLAPDQLLIMGEPFRTIQGEGPLSGMPATFIRLAGCNRGRKLDIGCEFCDTSFEVSKGHSVSFADLLYELEHRSPATDLIVLTGGEPFIQRNVVSFIEALLAIDRKVQVETNGDHLYVLENLGYPDLEFSGLLNLTIVVSPKVTRLGYTRLNERHTWASCLKYLVEADHDSPYHRIPDDAFWWRGLYQRPIYVSPITTYSRQVNDGEIANMWDPTLIDKEKTAANYRYAADVALQTGAIVSVQKHLLLNIP